MKSIVIIDDHPAIRMAIRSLLENSGEFTVTFESDNGMDALSYLKKHQTDLVILDLELPNFDGFEVLHRLKAADIRGKVLFLSAKNEGVYAIRAMKAGANGYISKNKDLNDIFHAVKMVLSGYSFFPAAAMDSLNVGKHHARNSAFETLSNRELMIARLLAQGRSNLEIGQALAISNKTVSTYKVRIFQKLNIASVVELAQQVTSHDLA